MKKIISLSSQLLALSLIMILCLTSCMDNNTPEDETMTEEQVMNSPTAIRGLANAIPEKFATAGSFDTSNYFDTGYTGLCLVRDVIGEDMAVASGSDYYYYWGSDQYIGENYATTKYPWNWYYSAIAKCNILIKMKSKMTDDTKQYFAEAYFYRALCYFDMARMYEYKKTGNSDLDAQATENGAYNLTVPRIDETATEAVARNTPRLTCAQMYLFLLSDLTEAGDLIAGTSRTVKNAPDINCVYGELARVYLDMATRFRLDATQLTDFIAVAEAAGFTAPTTVKDYYKLALDYATLAIAGAGSPLTESEWYGAGQTGFNSVSATSWMLGVIVTKENLNGSYMSSIGNLSPEQTYGFAGFTKNSDGTYTNKYNCQRTISKALFDQITTGDWRKTTWIDPADAGQSNPGNKYVTTAPDAMFKEFPKYTGLKFRPVNGNRTDYTIGCAADYPLMRVEEMYFIKMEAELYYSDMVTAKTSLESFMNTYRMKQGSTYTCPATTDAQMLEAILTQKRIEFWGEGVTYFDYKRLNHRVNRRFTDSNFPTSYQYKSEGSESDNYVPCTYNFYIPLVELNNNKAMTGHGNPDPTGKAKFKD